VTRLLRVEFRRLRQRRLFRLLLLGMFLTLVAIIVGNGVLSNRNLAAARAQAAAEAQSALKAPPPFMVGGCGGHLKVVTAPRGAEPGPATNNPCVFYAPNAQQFYADPRFSFALNATHLVTASVALASIVGFVMGTGFIGAEWTAGTFPLLLTWEPRRLRVLSAKLGVVMATFVVIGVVSTLLVLAGGWVVAATRGTTAGMTTTAWHEVLWYSVRGLALIALLSGAGAAIAGLTRHTSAALVGAIGYLVVFEFVVRRLHPEWIRWFLTSNAGALLGGWASLDVVARGPVFKFTPVKEFVLHADRAALYLGVLFVLVVAAWAVVLVRQDVNEGGQ
jgi:ABC-2 type transport system permease protein